MQPILQNNMGQLQALCVRHGVQTLHVFGSAVRADFNEESDVDFLIEYKCISETNDHLRRIESLSNALRSLFNREVDLIEYHFLENKYLKHFINQEKILLYAEA